MMIALAILGAVVLLVLAALAGVLGFALHRRKGTYFDSNGVRIHYTDEGQGEPIILIHGFAVHTDLNWRAVGIIRALARKYRVIAMDNRGHGLSGTPHEPEAYGLEMVEDVIRLMDHLGIEKAHVAGYSMGGFLTLKLAMTHPGRLLSAAVCGAGWIQPTGGILEFRDTVASALESGQGILPLQIWLRPPGTKPHLFGEWVVRVFLESTFDSLALAACMRAFDTFAVTESELRANTLPVLTIVGTADPLREGVDLLTGVLAKHESLFIEGGDHMTTIVGSRFRNGLMTFMAKHGKHE